MLRAALHKGEHEQVDSDGFRLLGTRFSRLDAFSDVVFGFALTLLVVSLEVPRSYSELHHLLRGFIPFALSFLLSMLVWYGHFRFFRRFGTHDAGTIWLNGLLLFTVLFYVYPLKFLFMTMLAGAVEFGSLNQVRELVLLYAGGLAAIYLLFGALYANALRQWQTLGLTPLEKTLTRYAVWDEAGVGIIGLLVCGVALLLPAGHSPVACFGFLFIGIWKWFVGRKQGRLARTRDTTATPSDGGKPATAASMNVE